MPFFDELKSYENYLIENPFHEILNIDLDQYGEISKKIERSLYYSVNPDLKEAFSAELDNLVRLHYLVTSRKVTTVLEFGFTAGMLKGALAEGRKKQ